MICLRKNNLIYIKFPALGPAVESDTNKEHIDRSYSGYYIITTLLESSRYSSTSLSSIF